MKKEEQELYPMPSGITGEDKELWENWHQNNDAGYQYGSKECSKYPMLVEQGENYHVDIECDVQRCQNYGTSKKTLRRLSFSLYGYDSDCRGSLLVQYGHDNGNGHMAHGCDAEVFDIQDFDAEEMYKLGHAFIRLARTLRFDDQTVIEEQRKKDKEYSIPRKS